LLFYCWNCDKFERVMRERETREVLEDSEGSSLISLRVSVLMEWTGTQSLHSLTGRHSQFPIFYILKQKPL
jgi:hypothetical protein